MISRTAFQVLVFDLPPLPPQELEAAARFRVRSLSPLHPDQYRVFLDALPGKKKVTILAFLVLDGAVEAGTLAPFPARLPSSWTADCILCVRQPEAVGFYVYHDRRIQAVLPPASQPAAEAELRDALGRDYPGLPLHDRSVESLPASLFPRMRATLPRDRSLRWALVALGLGAVVLLVGAMVHLDQLRTRNLVWEQWLQRESALVTASTAPTSVATSAELRAAAGFPLVEVLQKLQQTWPNGVQISLLETRGRRLQLEASATSALPHVQRLLADPWFASLKVVRIQNKDGVDTFVLEGEVNDDL